MLQGHEERPCRVDGLHIVQKILHSTAVAPKFWRSSASYRAVPMEHGIGTILRAAGLDELLSVGDDRLHRAATLQVSAFIILVLD